MKFRALEAALAAVWAMEPTALERLLEIAAREHETSPEALEAYRAKSLAGAEAATVRDGVAIISADGPMFKRANLMTAISGATSYETIMRDLTTAANDRQVKAILARFDTPGGDASGTNELAHAIRALRGVKPIVAYVGGDCSSAGYWLASACDEIVIDATAVLGSIGVQMALQVRDDPKGARAFKFVSSQSPMKNADPATEAGAAHLQGVVDAMAQVFVEAVASNRGVAIETVLSDFGKGGIFVGQDAVTAGLADRIGSFEGVMAELSASRRKGKAKGAKMEDEQTFTAAQRDAAVTAAVTAALTADHQRVAGINAAAVAFKSTATDVAAAIVAGTPVAEFNIAQAAGMAAREEAAAAAAETIRLAALASLETDETRAARVAASNGNELGEQTEDQKREALAAAIIAA